MSRASNIVNWPSPCFKLVVLLASDRSDSLRLALQVSMMLWLPRSFAFYTRAQSPMRGWLPQAVAGKSDPSRSRSPSLALSRGETLDYKHTHTAPQIYSTERESNIHLHHTHKSTFHPTLVTIRSSFNQHSSPHYCCPSPTTTKPRRRILLKPIIFS